MDDGEDDLIYLAPVLRVADLARSIAYYREQLGFTLEFVHEGFYASVRRGPGRLHLQCAMPAVRDQAAFEHAQHLDVTLAVRDAAGLERAFAAAGARFTQRLRVMPYGTEFYVRDPDGYVLGFVQPA